MDKVSPSVDELQALFREQRVRFAWWLDAVSGVLSRSLPPALKSSVHTVRSRLKDDRRLAEKIERLRAAHVSIDESNFFSTIDDLATVQVITRLRHDVRDIADFIGTSEAWQVQRKSAFACSTEDVEMLTRWGHAPTTRERLHFACVHFLVCARPTRASATHWVRCEVQVRSLRSEGW